MYLVEAVEVAFTLLLVYNPGLLQEVGLDVPTMWVPLEVKMDVHVLALCTKSQTYTSCRFIYTVRPRMLLLQQPVTHKHTA